MNSFYSADELNELGFKSIGQNVLISRKASIYNADKIHIGNNVRIDDFCIISGEIIIGSYVHIAAYSALFGGDKGIVIQDFAGLSSRVSVYAATDDYSGGSLTNPMVPDKYKNVFCAEVIIERHVIIGAGSVILPGVVLKEGSSFGALSLISRPSEPWSVNAGIPAKKVKERSRELLELEKKFMEEGK